MYKSVITRKNPTLFVILVDQSGSIEEKVCINSVTMSKSEYVCWVINNLFTELRNRCVREEGVRDYFGLLALGYSDNGIKSLMHGKFEPVMPSHMSLMDKPCHTRLEERKLANGQTAFVQCEQTRWIEPCAEGNTPMYTVLVKTHELVAAWCAQKINRDSYPPVVINISDGEATDSDAARLIAISESIRQLHTTDGNVLLINVHITGDTDSPSAIFPVSEDELPHDKNARLLYDMSSEMPETYNQQIIEVRNGRPGTEHFKGISYNTPVTELVAMMNIGSISVNLIS